MNKEFKAHWADAPKYPDGARFIVEDDRFWVSRDASGAAILFVQEDNEQDVGQIEDIFSGLSIYHDRSIKGYRIVCRLEEQNLESKFGYVCEDIAKGAIEHSGHNLFKHLVNQLKEWSGFLRPKRIGLSEEKFLGLWGELWVVANHYIDKFDPAIIAHTYTGPDGGAQDFSSLDFTLEVKSTYSKTPKTLSISSLEQLDARCDYQGICLLRVDLSDEGSSLNSMVTEIEAYLVSDPDALTSFRRKSSELLGEASVKQMEIRNIVIDERCWRVTNSFPALRRSETPVEISRAEYSISLGGIQDFEISSGVEGYLDAVRTIGF
jgi:hypothetical protein